MTADEFRAKHTHAGQLAAKRKPVKKSKEQREAEAKLKRRAKAELDAYFSQLCVSAGLPRPTPEYKFSATRKWRIDYYFERKGLKVALEVEGGAFTGGRHTRGAGFIKDIEKYNALSAQGIYLIRTTPSELTKQGLRDVLAVYENEKL